MHMILEAPEEYIEDAERKGEYDLVLETKTDRRFVKELLGE
jgi:hypothetical protein